jgi:HEAT repeat protein
MRQTNSQLQSPKLSRGRALVCALACVCLAALLAFAAGTRAQQPQNTNAQQQPAKPHTKRITPLHTSDGSQGSRVTITSDGELNDYSAYRSGDRFIVVIPQAEGGGGDAARGRGFEGAQVSRRGNDLVYTFKLQPGASAKVNQRFNRLDVQFTAPKDASAQATPQPAATPRTAPELSGIKPTPNATPTPANARTSATPAANQTVTNASPTGVAATNPNEVSPSLGINTTPSAAPSTTPQPAPSVSPAVASATNEQIAQAQASPAVPVNIVSPSSTGATTATLGATIQRNWYWIIGGLLVVGVGLLIFSRLGEREPDALPPPVIKSPAMTTATPRKSLDEPTTAKLEARTSATTAEIVPAATTAAIALAAETATVRSKKDRKGKKGKKDRAARRAEQAASATPLEAKTNAATPSTPSTNTTTATTSPATAAETSATAGTKVSDDAKKIAEAAAVAAPLVVGAAELASSKPAEEKSIEVAADSERVSDEIRKLFAGEPYDESVLNSRNAATREMVSSELLAALSSRNPQRNERAREAFLKHGYFEDATRDLQSAEAPARRASAAQALSLLHDRAATPHLVAALDDPAPDVRRASVEALAALRDPSALGALEALRWRETSRQVPRTLIQNAVAALTSAAEESAQAEASEATLVTARTAASEAASSATEGATDEDITIEAAAPSVEEEVETIAGVEISRASQASRTSDASAADEATNVEASHLEAPHGAATTVEATSNEAATADEAATVGKSIFAEPSIAESAVESKFEVDEPAIEETKIEETKIEEPATIESQAIESPAFESSAAEPTMFEPHAFASLDAPTSQVESAPFDELESGASKIAEPSEIVYTLDEHDAAAWSARRDESGEAQQGRRGTGGLDARESTPVESFDETTGAAAESSVYSAPEFAAASGASVADEWIDVGVEEQHLTHRVAALDEAHAAPQSPASTPPPRAFESLIGRAAEQPSAPADEAFERATPTPHADATSRVAPERGFVSNLAEDDTGMTLAQKGIELSGVEPEDVSIIPKAIQLRLGSEDVGERAASVRALARLNTGEAFQQICVAFDDPAQEVRDAAARALYDISGDRAETFTRALRESPPERRRQIGASLSSSGLAEDAVSQLTGESRERTYDAFSLLFLMAKAGETAPLIRAVETHPDNEVRLAVVKLLALSGQQEVLPSFRRLAVRGSLPTEVRSAVMEAIYQISSAGTPPAPKPTRTVS